MELERHQPLSERFTLLRPLGRGGMGEVWLVNDRELDERVVAKLLPGDAGPEQIDLLRRELRAARRLRHPNIAQSFDLHRAEGRAFIVMEYVEGAPLTTLHGRPLEVILPVVRAIAEALDYAHRRGVVHRDLKPSNVVIDGRGEPQLLDFGIAGLLSENDGRQPVGGGSPRSSSPQQLAGSAPAIADDVFGLGALLYELLTASPPTSPPGGARAADALDQTHPPLPEELRRLVLQMLAPRVEDRPADMAEIGAGLRQITERLQPSQVVPELERERSLDREGKRSVELKPPPKVRAIPPLVPPARQAQTPLATVRRRSSRWPLVAAGAALLVAVPFLFVLLPRWAPTIVPLEVGEPSAAPGMLEAPEPATVTSPDLRQLAAREATAESLLERVRGLADRLEGQGAASWAAAAYAVAAEKLRQGEGRLAARDPQGAEAAFVEALDAFEELSRRARTVLEQALEDGRRALAAEDRTAALAAFELALAISPAHPAARAGRERAEVVDRVAALLRRGQSAEERGERRAAAEHYRQALRLDRRSHGAAEGLRRVESRLEEEAFAHAMSKGLQALDEGQLAAARTHFEVAGRLRPAAAEVRAGLARVEESVRLEEIGRHRRRARELEQREEWTVARESYAAALALDPTLKFARVGQTRSRERAELDRRLVYHLAHPARFQAPEVLAEAAALREEAAATEPAGPRLRSQVERLDRLLAEASEPVEVTLVSDDLTEVEVFRVGRLGTFESRTLELRPGTYTVVGSRSGYRDVRRQLSVVAGSRPEPLVVRCEEAI